jgi:hypothetical protein
MKIKIQDIEVEYHVFHREVKYARLEIKNETLNVILPSGFNDHPKLIKNMKNGSIRKYHELIGLKKNLITVN